MQFKQNADVVTADGEDVGRIDRVVMDPRTKEVTHLVVRQGLLFTEDKLLPINLIARSEEDRIVLRLNARDLDDLPDFQETAFITPNEGEWVTMPQAYPHTPALYWYPPVAGIASEPLHPWMVRAEPKENIPAGTIALKEGASVITADDKYVGDVERILTGPEANRVTHFAISQGLLFKEKRLVPVTWVSDIGQDKIYLAVTGRTLEELRPYDE